jgi:hypothetical protein
MRGSGLDELIARNMITRNSGKPWRLALITRDAPGARRLRSGTRGIDATRRSKFEPAQDTDCAASTSLTMMKVDLSREVIVAHGCGDSIEAGRNCSMKRRRRR